MWKTLKEEGWNTDSIGKIKFENELESQRDNFNNFYTCVTAIAEGVPNVKDNFQNSI